MPLVSLSSLPDLMGLQAMSPADFPVLLQSAGDSGWDILMALPQQSQLWECDDPDFWSALAALPQQPVPPEWAPLPFHGGWFVYLGYELLHELEPTVAGWPEAGFPKAALMRIPAAVMYQRATGQAWLLAETEPQLAHVQQLLRQPVAPVTAPLVCVEVSEEAPEGFLDGVHCVKRYIREGDVFQVNLSRRWQAELAAGTSPASVYHALRAANPGPFNALVHLDAERAIISSSPERLVAMRDGRASTRPIAGTHPRLADPQADAEQKARLLGSRKERAEHVMLIDLERNDLGRIAQPGSVRVDELMSVETYAFVHHIESVVSAAIRPEKTPAEVLAALFPGGTITGCPKVRCMQIIRELESGPRGAYTGSLGYLNHDGSGDFNILIRTFMQQGNHLQFRAGAGIVADSDPERELQETRAKARGLLRALGVGA